MNFNGIDISFTQFLYSQIVSKYSDNIVEGFKMILETKGYPKDNDFNKLQVRKTILSNHSL
jgi:transposase